MPLINVKVIEGVFTPEQKTQIAERLTDAMVSIEGENMRQVTWCVIDEVKSGDWAIGGQRLTTEACTHSRPASPPRHETSHRQQVRRASGIDAYPVRRTVPIRRRFEVQDRAIMEQQLAGAVAVTNEEAVRAWDTVLYGRWKSNRRVFVGALDGVTEEVFERFPPPVGGYCIDIGCGFGDTTQRLAKLVGPRGLALGTDSSRHFIEDALREAAEADVDNIKFELADAQTAQWEPIYDYAFSRMGTQFFASPVVAMRAIHGALKPGGKLRKLCWRRKADSAIWAETEEVASGSSRARRSTTPTRAGPVRSRLGILRPSRGILEAAGFTGIELDQRDFDYFMGADMDEAIESLLAIGPGAELIRLNGEYGESRRDEIAQALREHSARWQKPDGSIVGRGSVWLITATNPG